MIKYKLYFTEINIIQLIKQFAYKYLGGNFGGAYSYYDDILEFDPPSGEWSVLASMLEARNFQAVSVVNYASELCV